MSKGFVSLALFSVLIGGCAGSGMTNAQMAANIEREEAWRGVPTPGYYEFTHDGKTYVAGYPESQAKIKAGGKFSQTQKGFGYGPEGSTVYFEDNKIGLGDMLVKQYQERHGVKAG